MAWARQRFISPVASAARILAVLTGIVAGTGMVQTAAAQSIRNAPGMEGAPDTAVVDTARDRIAILRALDKVTARTVDLEVPIDQPIRFGTLDVTVRYCRTRPPEEPPETFAFLEVDDHPDGRPSLRLFTGWMVASSPALNPLEHPVYDIWVVGCRHPERDVEKGLEENSAAE